ncbi:MAG: MFS transporter [Verrucomicrobia bacterium]|nr:MFS transporter [Verrucomicrobiota bacterium]
MNSASAPSPAAPLTPPASAASSSATVLPIIFAVSAGHLLNDTIQSLLPALYPILKDELSINFAQVGLITLAFQLTASILQPLVGIFTDRHPQPYSLPTAMVFTLCGVVLLAFANTFPLVLVAAAFIGFGSSIFHPEASRVARLASGGKYGLAQSIFQVGGNTGSALGPLLASVIIAHRSQSHAAWFALVPLIGFFVLMRASAWYSEKLAHMKRNPAAHRTAAAPLTRGRTIFAIAILGILIFSKFFYMACLGSYYTFYLIDTFHVSVDHAQLYLFLFLAACAVGTFIGGPVGDRIGRKTVIWVSILGVAPFALLLPHANLLWCAVLSVVIGVILSSAFSAILVYAQELVPSRVGLISGLFFGFAFGMGGIGSAVLGYLADQTSITYVFHVCAWLPLIGLLTAFLPDTHPKRAHR